MNADEIEQLAKATAEKLAASDQFVGSLARAIADTPDEKRNGRAGSLK